MDLLNKYQDEIDRKLLEYYNIKESETDYIDLMKSDREKYGMTYDFYRLLSE